MMDANGHKIGAEYWFKIDTAFSIDYICQIGDESDKRKTAAGTADAATSLRQIMNAGETLGECLPARPRGIEVFENWQGQWWAIAGRRL